MHLTTYFLKLCVNYFINFIILLICGIKKVYLTHKNLILLNNLFVVKKMFSVRFEMSVSKADKLSLVISLMLSVHTALYNKLSESTTTVIFSVLIYLFFINTLWYLKLYLNNNAVFWNVTFLWLGNVSAYTVFFIVEQYHKKASFIVITILLFIYSCVAVYRKFMMHIYNYLTECMEQYDQLNFHCDEEIAIISDSLFMKERNCSGKAFNWWSNRFSQLKYSIDLEGKIMYLKHDNFNNEFNENCYNKNILGHIISCFTDKTYIIKSVTKKRGRVTVKYMSVDDEIKGECFKNLISFNPLKQVSVKVEGPMSLENHVYDEHNEDVDQKYALLLRFSNYGWFKKDLSYIIPSKNTCKPLPPLNYEDRLDRKNEFINTLPKTGNTKRLSSYMEECIKWYHNKKFKKTATLEYRKRWENHIQWILGSPILVEKDNCDVVINISHVMKIVEIETEVDVLKTIIHEPVGKDNEIDVELVPNSTYVPPPIQLPKNHINKKYSPAEGFSMKNYRTKIVRDCICGEKNEEFTINSNFRNQAKMFGKVQRLNLDIKTDKVMEKRKEITKTREVDHVDVEISFKSPNMYEVLEVEIEDVMPHCLSSKSVAIEQPKYRKEINRMKNDEKIKNKKAKKTVKRNNEKVLPILNSNKTAYNRKNLKPCSRPGNVTVKKPYQIIERPSTTFEEWFNRLNKNNGFPKCDVKIINKMFELPSTEVRKIFRIGRKHIKFLNSSIKTINKITDTDPCKDV